MLWWQSRSAANHAEVLLAASRALLTVSLTGVNLSATI